MNCLVALSSKSPDFPSPLYDNGFQLETIEPRVLLRNSQEARPDIQFKKNDDQLAFFECKAGACKKQQMETYMKITIDDLRNSKITSLPISEISLFDIVYFGTEQKKEKLTTSIDEYGNPFPIVILEDNRIARDVRSGNFKSQTLNGIFSEIVFKTPVPLSYIPFSASDDDEVILSCILWKFLGIANRTFTLNELLYDLFGNLIHHYDAKEKDALKSRIGHLLSDIMVDPDFPATLVFDKRTSKYVF